MKLAKVAWIVDKDNLFDELVDLGLPCREGTVGPRAAPDHLIMRLEAGEGRPWITFCDGEETPCYEGRILIEDDEEDPEVEFAPLENFAAPDAGCTEIHYQNPETGKWEQL